MQHHVLAIVRQPKHQPPVSRSGEGPNGFQIDGVLPSIVNQIHPVTVGVGIRQAIDKFHHLPVGRWMILGNQNNGHGRVRQPKRDALAAVTRKKPNTRQIHEIFVAFVGKLNPMCHSRAIARTTSTLLYKTLQVRQFRLCITCKSGQGIFCRILHGIHRL